MSETKVKITLNTKMFVERVLRPISRISNKCVLNIRGRMLYSVALNDRTGSDQVVLMASCPVQCDCPVEHDADTLTLNIGDPSKYIQVMSIQMKNLEKITLVYDGVSLKYNASKEDLENGVQIKNYRFMLMADGGNSLVTYEKIESFRPSTTFEIDMNHFKASATAISAMTVANSNKIYINTVDNNVVATVTDKTVDGSDCIDMDFATSFKGNPLEDVIISTSIFPLLGCNLTNDSEITVGVCEISKISKVVFFNVSSDSGNCKLKFCIPTKVS